MATDIQISQDGGSTWTSIDFAEDWRIDIPLSDVGIAPTATVTTRARESITPGDRLRIRIDGATKFEGETASGGTIDASGQRRVEARHDAVRLFNEEVDVSLSGPPDDQAVLNEALNQSQTGGSFTLSHTASNTSLGDDYQVSDRAVKQIFRDMMDRADTVWWVDPVSDTINVDDRGARGQWQDFDADSDGVVVREFDEGPIDTVRNSVLVFGTGSLLAVGFANDTTSIGDYGVRTGNSPYNVDYISSQSEAQDYAESLIQPDPLAAAELAVPESAATVIDPQLNKTLGIEDSSKGIDAIGLTVEKQTIRQGRAIVQAGQGKGEPVAEANRRRKSDRDLTRPGTDVGTGRIGDDAVDTAQLVDLSVANSKLDDLAVDLNKVQDGAIDTVKISDDAVEAPKILAGTITASEIGADEITANEIFADTITANEIAGDTITANEISSSTITADQIDTLDIDAGTLSIVSAVANSTLEFAVSSFLGNDFMSIRPEGSGVSSLGTSTYYWSTIWVNDIRNETDNSGTVGTSSTAWKEMHSHNFVTASPEQISAPERDQIRDADWYENPPDAVRQRARDIGDTDAEIPEERDHAPVELGTMSNWLLEACKSQQEYIERLEGRVDNLETRVSSLESGGGA